ncbi:hypothetical protein EDD21DRAFT_362873 [Dissophora ornata]|nr:hypothetical protein EDD21DRAFT_362873 [Dissophora ornata]
MGQFNSTLAHTPSPSPPSSSSPSMPSLEELRDVPHRILASTNKALADLGGTIVSIAKPVMASIPRRNGNSLPPAPLIPPPPPPSVSSQIVLWVRKNPGKIVLGTTLLSFALVAGSVAYRTGKIHRQMKRRLRILHGTNRSRREVIVVTNVATIEGYTLSLDLHARGFIVFVAVQDQAKADEVHSWGKAHIHPVIVPDLSEAKDVEVLVAEVSAYLDEVNGALIRTQPHSGTPSDAAPVDILTPPAFNSPVFSSSSSFMLVEEEEHVSTSLTSNAQSMEEELSSSKHVDHPKFASSFSNTEPLYRLTAVIINPDRTDTGSIENLDVENWRRCFDINVTGTIQIAHHMLPLLNRTLALPEPKRRSPRVIFITSAITSNFGLPYQSAACASHHAIASIADSLRREVQHKGIDVVSLKAGIPGLYRTKEGPIFHGLDMNWYFGPYIELLHWWVNPIKMLKSAFQQPATSEELCDAVFNAVMATRPAITQTVGKSGFAYSFVGWAAPSRVVDWSIRRAAVGSRPDTSGSMSTIYSPSSWTATSTEST